MKTELTRDLEEALWLYTSRRTFLVDEVNLGSRYGIVDVLGYELRGKKAHVWKCFEVKSSRTDFYSKAKKTFEGHYNYFVMPASLYEEVKQDIPDHVGVLIMRWGQLSSAKKAKRVDKLRLTDEHLYGRLITSMAREVARARVLKK